MTESYPPLKFLHAADMMIETKLAYFRGRSTEEILESLRPGQQSALKTRPDGTVLEGHHRILVLKERGVDCDALPREVIPRETNE